MVQSEYMAGHQLSVHTWSHPYLTKLTNEQIVAELGWTKKVIHDVTGVTPNTFRPPYGDIDDRVRAIAAQMGLTPIIWSAITANGTTTNFDTVRRATQRALCGDLRCVAIADPVRPTGTSPVERLLASRP
jgi:peptidoglycan/xylan/chitin deacetylase (PgdA/CDA1 family)